MTAEELLVSLRKRGFVVRLIDGALRVDPFPKLSPADRAALAEVAADPEARATLERLLRARESGTQGLAPADALMAREARRKFRGSPLVGIGRPGPRRRKDREQPDLTFEVIGPDDPVQPPVEQPPPAALEACPPAEAAGNEPLKLVADPAPAANEQPPLEPELEAPLRADEQGAESTVPCPDDQPSSAQLEPDPSEPIYDLEVTDPSAPEPTEEALERKQGIIWITIAPVQGGHQTIRVKPSPLAARRERPVRLCVEETNPSAVARFRLVRGPDRLWREVRLIRAGTELRIAIVL